MKKTLFSLALSFLISFSLPTIPAQAGVIAGAASGEWGTSILIGTSVGTLGYGIGFLQCEDGFERKLWAVLGTPLILMGALLDVEAALPREQMVEVFHQRYPFVDNSEALEELAWATQEKVVRLWGENGVQGVLVRFTKEEVQEIFAFTDLTSDQLVFIQEDLK